MITVQQGDIVEVVSPNCVTRATSSFIPIEPENATIPADVRDKCEYRAKIKKLRRIYGFFRHRQLRSAEVTDYN